MPKLLLRGQSLGTIKGVLFDKDGTLSNSEDHLISLAKLRIKEAVSLFQQALASQKELSMLEELLSKAYGINTEGLNPNGTIAVASRMQNFISTATVFCLLGKSWPQAQELTQKVFLNVDLIDSESNNNPKKRPLLPGVMQFLQQLNASGVKSAVISNDTTQGIKNFLRTHNLDEQMASFWSADHLPPKPDPSAVKGLCKVLDLQPAECALIGDAESDLKMAKEAGVSVILGYTAGWKTPPQLDSHQYLISHWGELSLNENTKVPANI